VKIVHRVLLPIGRQVDESLLDESAATLGLLTDGKLDIRAERELGTVLEFALYEVRRDGETLVERYVRTHPPDPGTRDGRVLRALPDARLAVFLIDGVEEGVGMQVHDLLGGPPAFVADETFGDPQFLGERFAGRLLTVDDVTISVGGFMPFDAIGIEDISYDLVERFPGRPVDSLHTLAGQDRTDAAVIIARAGIESRDWLVTQVLQDVAAMEGTEELEAALTDDRMLPPPAHPSRPKRRRR
jgi:hypothetical protein